MRHGKCGWASARGTPVVVLMLGLGLAALGPPGRLRGQTGVPRPDHVVLVIEENKSYNAIIGSPSAPYINDLTHRGALFISSYAIRHPSQPNYLALFSGSLHGIGDDSCPHSFTGANLAGALLDGGFTFIGYSESMPRPGYRGCSAGSYERKHNPWVNFVDLPDSVNLPYSSFPTDYNQLPAVAIVVPNQANDMHDGPISRGDAWLQTHLEPYVQWAMTNNSLFILTWDEGHNGSDNRVVTLFAGAMVQPGQYCERIDHYTTLRTLLEMYGLTPFEKAVSADPITSPWTPESAPSPVAVAMTSPPPGTTIPGPATLRLQAEASAGGSEITNVDFFERATFLGRALTAPFGLTLSNVAPGKYCFVVKATDAFGRRKTSRSVPVEVVDPFPAVRGVYHGLIQNPGDIAPETSGLATIAVDARGRFTARPRIGTRTYRFAGSLDASGQGTARATMPLPASPGPGVVSSVLELALSLNLTNGSDRVEGFLTQIELGADGNAISSNEFATVVAGRSPFDARTNAAPQAGRYTIVFAGDGAGVVAPGGDGIGTVTVDAGGRVRFSGVLADGTPVTAGSVVVREGLWPLYVPIAGGAGMVAGWIGLADAPSVEVSGCPTWTKPASVKAKYYPAGFSSPACVAGSRYQRPVQAGERILNLTNGAAVFAGGNVSGSFTNSFLLQANGAVLNTGDGPFKMTFSKGTGLFQGTTELGTGQSLKFRGAVLQADGMGRGFVLGSDRVGLVRLEPRPPD